MIQTGVRNTTMQGIVKDGCGIILLVPLAHITRRHLEMSQFTVFFCGYTIIKIYLSLKRVTTNYFHFQVNPLRPTSTLVHIFTHTLLPISITQV